MCYAEQQKEAAQHKNERNESEKWNFFLGLDPLVSFDLLEQTKPLVNEYREVLKERFPAQNCEEPDFTKNNWWE